MVEFNLDNRLKADSLFIADLELSTLRLCNEKKFPWVILVPRKVGLVELTDLSLDEYKILNQEVYDISRKLKKLYSADKMNVAALGNVVSQLHVHIIARYKSDSCWPNPVWGNFSKEEYSEDESNKVISEIKSFL